MQWYLDNAEKKAMTILCGIEAANLIFKCYAMLIILNIIHPDISSDGIPCKWICYCFFLISTQILSWYPEFVIPTLKMQKEMIYMNLKPHFSTQ